MGWNPNSNRSSISKGLGLLILGPDEITTLISTPIQAVIPGYIDFP